MTDRLLLMEIHAKWCRCHGGAYAVAAGASGNPGCLGPAGELPPGVVVTSMEQWHALGKPMNAEDHQAALRRIAERREAPRFAVSINVRLLRDGAAGAVPLGLAVTENLGEGGAMLLTPVSLAKGEEVVMEEHSGALRARSVVQAVSSVPVSGKKEPVYRVRLRFLDAESGRQVRKLLYMKAHPGTGG
jgi:hypothetical protein